MRVEIAEGPGAVVGVAGRRGGARRRGAAAARNGAGRGAAGVAGQPLDRVAQPVAPARRRGLGARQVHPRQGIILSFFLSFFLSSFLFRSPIGQVPEGKTILRKYPSPLTDCVYNFAI